MTADSCVRLYQSDWWLNCTRAVGLPAIWAAACPLARPVNSTVLVGGPLLVKPRRGLFQPLELVVLRYVDKRLQKINERLPTVAWSVFAGACAACSRERHTKPSNRAHCVIHSPATHGMFCRPTLTWLQILRRALDILALYTHQVRHRMSNRAPLQVPAAHECVGWLDIR